MQYYSYYASPIGDILLAANTSRLIGLWFTGQKHYASTLGQTAVKAETDIIQQAKVWLDAYFASQSLPKTPPYDFIGTAFQKHVWQILAEIPYGQTTTYGAIAAQIARERSIPKMSAQAVGSTIARNPISIIVPCHRVLAASHQLTGYAAGLDRKAYLLKLEATSPLTTSP